VDPEENNGEEEADTAKEPEPIVKTEEVAAVDDSSSYERQVETTEKTRVKNLKNLILEDMNLKDTCAIRLYKDSEPLIGDMDLIKEINLERVQVELYYTL
jgi:hypothetical protein